MTFAGERTLSHVSPAFCKDYCDWQTAIPRERERGGGAAGLGGARRDLEDLRAAIAHHEDKRLHRGFVETWLPERGDARERWLTRDEAAAILWACWRAREKQRRVHGSGKAGAEAIATAKHTQRHLARFILLGLYSGTRAASIAASSFVAASGRSYVDLDQGVFYRRRQGARRTKKRQPSAPLAPRLLAHLRRWRRLDLIVVEKVAAADRPKPGDGYIVEYRGRPVASVKTAFASAVKTSGVPSDVTPHTLRHTAATWLMHADVSQYDASRYLGMSMQTLDRVYATPATTICVRSPKRSDAVRATKGQ